MSTTSRRTPSGSRAPWSGLLDVLLGRVPARNAGFFQHPQSEPAIDDGTGDGAEDRATEPPAHVESSTGSSDAAVSDAAMLGEAPTPDHAPASDGAPTDEAPTDGAPTDEAPTNSDATGREGLRVQAERVSLDGEIGPGAVDGAWWPRSDRAADEVGELAEALPDDLGRLQRVALSMDDWSDDQPRAVHVFGHPLHLAWFTGLRRHTAHLTFEGGHEADLLVLPSDTEDAAAREVLEAVGKDRSRTDLLARAGIDLENEQQSDAQQRGGQQQAED